MASTRIARRERAARVLHRTVFRQPLKSIVWRTIESLERRLLLSGSIGINFADGSGSTGIGTNSYNLAPTDVAGMVPIAHWNNARSNYINPPVYNPIDGTLHGLTDDAGNVTGASVAWEADGTWDATLAGQTDQFPAGPNHSLMAGYLDNFGGTATAPPSAIDTFTIGTGAPGGPTQVNGIFISGLSGLAYTLYCYSMQPSTGRGGGVTVTGAASVSQSVFTAQQYSSFVQGTSGNVMVFRGVQPHNGKILIASDGTSFRVTVQGIELVQYVATAPGSIGINFADGSGSTGIGTNSYNLAPTDVAGMVPIAHWNNTHSNYVNSTGVNPIDGSLYGLTDDAGNVTHASVEWEANGTWDAAALENQTDQFPAGPNHNLMAGYVDNFGGTPTAPPSTIDTFTIGTGAPGGPPEMNGVLISGLSGASYNLYCYSMQSTYGRGGSVTVTGATSTTLPMFTAGQYTNFVLGGNGNVMIFRSVQPHNGKILLATDGVSPRLAVNGIELVPNLATAPPTLPGIAAGYDTSTATVALRFGDNDPSLLAFSIQRSTSPTGPFTEIAQVAFTLPGPYLYSDSDVVPGASYYYQVVAQNGAGDSLSNVSGPVLVPANVGVEAHYYNVAFWASTPAISTQVMDVNGSWPSRPDPAIRGNENSMMFTGQVRTDAAGVYTFVSNTNGDGYLYVNGQLVSFDQVEAAGVLHSPRNATNLFPISLAANTRYDFVLAQSETNTPEAANLLWIEPGGSTPTIVPATHLSPRSDTPQTPTNLRVDPASTLSPNPNPHGVDLIFDSNNVAVTKYRLERTSDNGATWSTVGYSDPQGSIHDPANFAEYVIHVADASALPGKIYVYRVEAMNFDATSAPSGGIALSTPGLPAQTGGAEARYFNGEVASAANGEDPTQIMVNGTPAEFYADQQGYPAPVGSGAPIDAAFGNASPDPTPYSDVYRVHPDDFATLFTGKIHTAVAGTYTFITNTDDDGYLWVNKMVLSQDPGYHGQQDAGNVVPISLAANSEYDFILIQQEIGITSGVHLSWIAPDGMGGRLPEQLIPAYTPARGSGLEMNMDPPDRQFLDPATGATVTDPSQSAAGNLTFAQSTSAGNVLTWTDQSFSELWFQVERSADGTNFSAIGKAGFNATSFTDTTAVAGTHYYYRVRGMNFDFQGVASKVLDTSCGVMIPTPVLTASACIPGEIDLTFTGQSPQSGGFELQYHDNTSSAFMDVPGAADLPNTTTNYAVTGLDPTKTYTFQARNLNGPTMCGESAYSPAVTASAAGSPAVEHSTGFDSGETDLRLNGSASIAAVGTNTVLRLTPQQINQAASVYFTQPEDARAFDTTFDFQFNQGASNPGDEGFTFTIQNAGLAAVGDGGGNLGYQGIGQSIALKFDLSPGVSTTGLYTNGSAPDDTTTTSPGTINAAYDMTGSGIDWHARFADTFRAHLAYDGTTLTETVIDLTTNSVFTMSWQINVPQIVGDDCAFVGFTGATGGTAAEQDILDWQYVAGEFFGPPQTIVGTSGNDTVTLRVDPNNPTGDDVWVDVPEAGPPTVVMDNTKPIVINGAGGNDTLIVDSSNGQPIPAGSTGLLLMGTFTLSGNFPALDANHTLDLANSTFNVPYTGASILPAVQTLLKNHAIFSSNANGSSGKFAISDTDASSQITLKYTVVGDLNGDGTVAFADLLALAQNYGKTGQDWAHGDLNYDGTVGFADLLALAQHYGQSAPALASPVSSGGVSMDSLDFLLGKKSRHRL